MYCTYMCGSYVLPTYTYLYSWGQKWLLFAMAVDICSVMVQMVSLADRAAIPSQTHRDTSGALELYGISAALKA